MNHLDTFGLLAADSPSREYASKLMLFGQFVGSWDVESTWHEPDGGTRSGTGEWHFAWILGGRGVQDVLFASGASPDCFGTTLRCYDAAIDAWHVTWMQPSTREFVHLIARSADDRIVLEGSGVDSCRRERWSFVDVTPDSFSWLGEVSFDQGRTWFLEQEMRAARRTCA